MTVKKYVQLSASLLVVAATSFTFLKVVKLLAVRMIVLTIKKIHRRKKTCRKGIKVELENKRSTTPAGKINIYSNRTNDRCNSHNDSVANKNILHKTDSGSLYDSRACELLDVMSKLMPKASKIFLE